MRHEGAPTSEKDIILYFAITRLNDIVEDKEKFEKSVKIIELIWQKTNQEIRDSVCDDAIESFQNFQSEIHLSDIPAPKTVIEEMEEHKRVKGLSIELRDAIESLDVNRVEAALENCGGDVESVLERELYWAKGGVDLLLVYPLIVDYERNPDKEELKKRKEITKLLWDKASPDVRNSWLEDYMVNREGQNTGRNYIIDSLEEQQERFRDIAGEGWLKDFIQEVKDYRRQRDIQLNDSTLKEEDEQMLELAKQESLLNAPIATNTTEPTADNKTPEKNDTTFWSEHKGKIALGVTGLCVAGAVAAYVLAYPAVALALTVLAAVILMGAGIAKVCEKVKNPSVDKVFDKNEQLLNQ